MTRIKHSNDPNKLRLPVDDYRLSQEHWQFGDKVPRRFGLWGVHLGDDVVVEAGTSVKAIGEGGVVLAKTLPGSEEHRSWGGIVIIKHEVKIQSPKPKLQTKPKTQITNYKPGVFYSIYGHLKGLRVKEGDKVETGQEVGEVAGSYTPENGWWKVPHLHFAIYTGPWPAKTGEVLPGYWRPERFWQTRLAWWQEPGKFIEKYSQTQ